MKNKPRPVPLMHSRKLIAPKENPREAPTREQIADAIQRFKKRGGLIRKLPAEVETGRHYVPTKLSEMPEDRPQLL